ncbi:MAG: hypothetical protein HC895_06095 [Leptolyngbyaceae cyanobacterium SM1_3_5]|nr:hypothetical protein [Leptolyngbyaceae cyanobacterium SM1_3_5]
MQVILNCYLVSGYAVSVHPNEDNSQQNTMRHTRTNPSRLGSAIDALCIAPLLIAIAVSIIVDDEIDVVSTLISSAIGSD